LSRFLVASVPFLALAGGCYQQNLRLAVHEDGAGTIVVKERIGKDASKLLLGTTMETETRIHALLVEELASWDGVCAWTDAAAKVQDGEIVFEAKGWFEDVRKLERFGRDGLAQRFGWKCESDGTTLEWRVARAGMSPRSAAACRAVASRYQGTVIEATVVVPGSLVSVDGLRADENACGTLTLFSGPELSAELRALESRDASEDEIVAAVRKRLDHTIVARYETREPSTVRAAFKKELERDKAHFAETDLGQEIERARGARFLNDDGTAIR
jgi:hypothetical protein